MYLMMPVWFVEVSTVWPILSDDMAKSYLPVGAQSREMVEAAGVAAGMRRGSFGGGSTGSCRRVACCRREWMVGSAVASEKAVKVQSSSSSAVVLW